MNTHIEMIIAHGAAWLGGVAAVLMAVAQVVKAYRIPSSAKAAKAKQPAKRVNAPSQIPATIQRVSLWRVVGFQLVNALLCGVVLVIIALVNSAVTMRGVVAVVYFAGQLFFNLWWAAHDRDRYFARLRDGA